MEVLHIAVVPCACNVLAVRLQQQPVIATEF